MRLLINSSKIKKVWRNVILTDRYLRSFSCELIYLKQGSRVRECSRRAWHRWKLILTSTAHETERQSRQHTTEGTPTRERHPAGEEPQCPSSCSRVVFVHSGWTNSVRNGTEQVPIQSSGSSTSSQPPSNLDCWSSVMWLGTEYAK